jgi:hypothetical protein
VVTGSILRASLCRVLNLEMRASHEGSTLAGAALVSIHLVFSFFFKAILTPANAPLPQPPQFLTNAVPWRGLPSFPILWFQKFGYFF